MPGTYYKLQVWEEGRNRSRRVPAPEVPALQEDLANHTRDTELAAAYAGVIIARPRALRRASAASGRPPRQKTPRGRPAGEVRGNGSLYRRGAGRSPEWQVISSKGATP